LKPKNLNNIIIDIIEKNKSIIYTDDNDNNNDNNDNDIKNELKVLIKSSKSI
jgi:hypothetical protein